MEHKNEKLRFALYLFGLIIALIVFIYTSDKASTARAIDDANTRIDKIADLVQTNNSQIATLIEQQKASDRRMSDFGANIQAILGAAQRTEKYVTPN